MLSIYNTKYNKSDWKLHRRQEVVPDREDDSMLAGLIRLSTIPKEGVVVLPQRSTGGEPSFLQSCDAVTSFRSPLTMMAVFLVTAICCRFSERPGHKVRTFQLAKRSAGNFFEVFFCAEYHPLVMSKTISSMQELTEGGRCWHVST